MTTVGQEPSDRLVDGGTASVVGPYPPEVLDLLDVLDGLDQGVLVQTLAGRVLAANPAAAAILGIARDKLIAGGVDLLTTVAVRPDGSRLSRASLPARMVATTGQPQLAVVIGVRQADESVRWLEVSARPLRSGGRLVAVVSSICDITRRRLDEEKLRNAEKRQRLVLEHAAGGYAILGAGGRLIDGSATLFEWWGHRDTGQSTMTFEAMLPQDRRATERIIEQAGAAPGSPQRAELRARDPQGEVRWIELTATDQRGEPSVGGIVVNFTDITERKAVEQALAEQAVHDPVTGLPNRRLLNGQLELALANAARHGTRVAVLFFDVDHFKLINDSLGHAAGDDVLQTLAGRFRMGARTRDTVVRFGGDEFVVVCEALANIDQAVWVAQRLTEVVEEPMLVDETERVVTVSCGVSISQPGATPADLLRDADTAMNLAKERGRAHVEVFTDELRSQVTRRLDLASDLHRAMGRDELHLVYQPVVAVATGAPVGCEALLRWDNPDLGGVQPAEFIPVAERSGLIVPIGAWAIHRAVRQLREWHQRGLGGIDPWVSVSLSTRQLASPGLEEAVADSLRDQRIHPSRLHLEITEDTLAEDPAASIVRIKQLKALGVQVDVDSFGTACSSLSYLRRLPIDSLKIAETFIRGLDTDPTDTAIVGAIVLLGRALGLGLIAEGVETPTQQAALDRLGCELAQGMHWSEPLDADACHTWLTLGGVPRSAPRPGGLLESTPTACPGEGS